MITHRGLGGRTIFVIAITACVIAVAPSALAQETRADPGWLGPPVPGSQIQTTLLQNVQAMPASTFDPKLPNVSLDAWLFVTLVSRAEVVRSELVQWRVDPCNPYARGANPTVVTPSGARLCVEGTVQLASERNVHLSIVVADAVRGALGWRATSPFLRDVYIEHVSQGTMAESDSFDVPELSRLTDLLQVSFDQWPKVDFESQITWDPRKPQPGDTVRFSITVRNTGRRTADPALINILIAPCCGGHPEVRHEWFQYIAAGQSVRVDLEVPLPEGMAMAVVNVKLGPSDKRVLEARPDHYKRSTAVAVGYPPRPH